MKAASNSPNAQSRPKQKRDTALARYHQYEFASAAFQIGIVLASAEVITGIAALGWLSGLLDVRDLASWPSACGRHTRCIWADAEITSAQGGYDRPGAAG